MSRFGKIVNQPILDRSGICGRTGKTRGKPRGEATSKPTPTLYCALHQVNQSKSSNHIPACKQLRLANEKKSEGVSNPLPKLT